MPKVSVNILTKDRPELLKKALASVNAQSFKDFELVVINDGSTNSTLEVLQNSKIINHAESLGITISRQDALNASAGEYIAILDDDDEWVDADKLKKQVEFLGNNPEYVLVGSAIKSPNLKLRPETDDQIKNTMLFKNNFFTSSVVFRKEAAIKAGGFIKDEIDLAEDYDLWLRMGKVGKMYNFQEAFVNYRTPSYNKVKFRQFLTKQLSLVNRELNNYPYGLLAKFILKLRILLGF